MRVEFTDDPTKALTHKNETGSQCFISRLSQTGSTEDSIWALVLQGDELVALAEFNRDNHSIALEVAEMFWRDRGVLLRATKETYEQRKKIFENQIKDHPRALYMLWWLLDDIEMQCDALEDQKIFEGASAFAEQKLIEYVLTKQKEAVP